MWQWLFIPWIALLLAADPPTEKGQPAQQTEAQRLWQEGQKEYEAGNYAASSGYFSEVIRKHAGSPEFTSAHLGHGRSLLRQEKHEEAIPPLKYFINAAGSSKDALGAKLDLGKAYLGARKYHEAYLISGEIISRKKLAADVKTRAHLIRAEASHFLGNRTRAKQALDSAKREMTPETKSEVNHLDLRLKNSFCSQITLSGKISEEHARDQIDRRGQCLLESMLIFRHSLSAPDPKWAGESATDLSLALRTYHEICRKPPDPPGKRTALELKRYKEELSQVLRKDCQQKLDEASEMLRPWKETVRPEMQPHYQKIEHQLAELRARA